MTDAEKFWARVDRSRECWLYTGPKNENGYGMWIRNTPSKLAHRVAWMLTNGPISDELCVLHHCDNPPCVRPDHLWLGTRAENNADSIATGRKARHPWSLMTHCRRGHPFDETNTHLYGVIRVCRTCKRERMREHRARLKAA